MDYSILEVATFMIILAFYCSLLLLMMACFWVFLSLKYKKQFNCKEHNWKRIENIYAHYWECTICEARETDEERQKY